MRAVCWMGSQSVASSTVPDPVLLNPRDAIVRVRATTICGSDLPLFEGKLPSMERGDIIGHEFMGEVVEVGGAVRNLRAGDRVVVPAVIGCGGCFFCLRGEWSLCDNSNPNAGLAEGLWGQSPCGIFGSSHLMGGYAGSFAEYVRVPFADVGPKKVPEDITDEQALFASDAFPTGFMAADFCAIRPGDCVAVWGCGAVGQFAMKSARLLGAERIIAIDRLPERLQLAKLFAGAEPLDYTRVDVVEALKELTGGRGPDACIDAVGRAADGAGLERRVDRVKHALRLEPGRAHVLQEATLACRKGGVLSVVGEYGASVDRFPLGPAMNKGLTMRMGHMHAHRYLDHLLSLISRGEVDPSVMVTHRFPLDQAQSAFDLFQRKQDGCVRVVLRA